MTTDVLVKKVDNLPKTGTLVGIENVVMLPGGCAVNAAIDLKKLGADVALSCLIGEDLFGDALISKFNIKLLKSIFADPVEAILSSIIISFECINPLLYK